MPINPTIPISTGTPEGVAQQLADLKRLVNQALATRTIIGESAIAGTQIGDGEIGTSNIAFGAITADLIQAAAISTNHLQANAITADKIAANAITTDKLQANSITSDKIVAGAVTAAKINVSSLSAISADLGSVTAGSIVGATIKTATTGARVEIDASGIRGINAASVEKFEFDTTTGILTAAAVVSLEAGSVVPAPYISGTITNTQIADDSISTPKLQANSVTAAKITVSSLSAISADLGSITAGTITGTTITGATIRTASADPKLQMDATGLASYNASGEKTIDLTASNGLSLYVADSQQTSREISWYNSTGSDRISLYETRHSGWTVATINSWSKLDQIARFDISMQSMPNGNLSGLSVLAGASDAGCNIAASADSYLRIIIQGDRFSDFVQMSEPKARVYATAGQSIPNAVATKVVLSSTDWDLGYEGEGGTSTAHFDNANDRLIVRKGGKYQIKGKVVFDGSTGGSYRQARIHVNGTVVDFVTASKVNSATIGTAVECICVLRLNVGDYVELWTAHDSGAALNTIASNEHYTFLEFHRIAHLNV